MDNKNIDVIILSWQRHLATAKVLQEISERTYSTLYVIIISMIQAENNSSHHVWNWHCQGQVCKIWFLAILSKSNQFEWDKERRLVKTAFSTWIGQIPYLCHKTFNSMDNSRKIARNHNKAHKCQQSCQQWLVIHMITRDSTGFSSQNSTGATFLPSNLTGSGATLERKLLHSHNHCGSGSETFL